MSEGRGANSFLVTPLPVEVRPNVTVVVEEDPNTAIMFLNIRMKTAESFIQQEHKISSGHSRVKLFGSDLRVSAGITKYPTRHGCKHVAVMPRQDTCNKRINATVSSSPDRSGNGGDGCDSEFDESEGHVPYGLCIIQRIG
ncbi:hypothetical protein Tco_0771583 [Tanacetum coccineum]|uniref:Uncharacterized protein n=1 Tax=Tanacetum coccineum TaxID=301880 RepID=A0ABQ4ZJ15_9ASTR